MSCAGCAKRRAKMREAVKIIHAKFAERKRAREAAAREHGSVEGKHSSTGKNDGTDKPQWGRQGKLIR